MSVPNTLAEADARRITLSQASRAVQGSIGVMLAERDQLQAAPVAGYEHELAERFVRIAALEAGALSARQYSVWLDAQAEQARQTWLRLAQQPQPRDTAYERERRHIQQRIAQLQAIPGSSRPDVQRQIADLRLDEHALIEEYLKEIVTP